MNIQTLRFVTLSDLFMDCPAIAEIWHNTYHSQLTYGDCNRSLITKGVLEDAIADLCFDRDKAPDTESDIIYKRLKSIDYGVMIDLEN